MFTFFHNHASRRPETWISHYWQHGARDDFFLLCSGVLPPIKCSGQAPCTHTRTFTFLEYTQHKVLRVQAFLVGVGYKIRKPLSWKGLIVLRNLFCWEFRSILIFTMKFSKIDQNRGLKRLSSDKKNKKKEATLSSVVWVHWGWT